MTHAFIRVAGELGPLEEDLVVVQCSHIDVNGTRVTEALVTGPDALGRLQAAHPTAERLAAVQHAGWIEQCILAASGSSELASPGEVAVLALRSTDEELFLVEHPHALSGSAILAQVATRLDRWVEL